MLEIGILCQVFGSAEMIYFKTLFPLQYSVFAHSFICFALVFLAGYICM